MIKMKSVNTFGPHSDPPLPSEDPIKPAWEMVVLKGMPTEMPIKPEILRSWIECRDMEIDPYSENSPPVLSGNDLNQLLIRNKTLTDICKPVMDMIEISVRDTGFIVTLTDKKGYVLQVRGDREILRMAEKNFYLPGCLRSIAHAGTNAIGVCLVEGKSVQITGAEHYKVRHHPWTCSSSPIRNSHDQIIGSITLSGRSMGHHKHTIALVASAADTIESQLRERELIEEKQRLNAILSSIFNSISDGVIAVDNHNRIIRLNRTGTEMLGLAVDLVMGKRLDRVVEIEDTLLQALDRRKYFSGKEASFICPAGHRVYMCSVNPVQNAAGHTSGAIITMTQKRQVVNIAKKIGGNYAKYEFKNIKGSNPGLLRQIELAKVAAKTNSRILITGESGTGKELFAQAIHNYSNRRNQPFVAISCAAIPRDLIESELFGYRGGAFTGARRDGQVGKFEFAHQGTLFLDEVNGLPLDLQAKLLRVLQQNEIMRLGDTRPIPVDVRVISASNSDLMTEIENANFREDFYYRLNVVEIVIPPIRKRTDDLELLIDHIMTRHCAEMAIAKPELSNGALEIIWQYRWPGNVRELENIVERALLLSQGKIVRKSHLPERMWKNRENSRQEALSLHEASKDMIANTLDQCSGNISLAARKLKIARSTLYRKMKVYGVS